MSGRVRVSLIAIAASVALVALIVPLQAGASSVNPASQLNGYLALGFSPEVSPAGFRFYPSGTSLGTPIGDYQGISVNGCKVTTPPTSGTTGRAHLAAVSAGGSATQVGAAQSGSALIGLGAKPSSGSGASGTPCGQVNLNESLTVSLGSALSGYMMTAADLDLEAKFGTKINAQLFAGGNLVTPANAPPGCDPNKPGAFCITDTLPDSGPNCSGCNNWSFKIEPMDANGNPLSFDTIVLTPTVGENGNPNNVAFSLEGGQGDENRSGPQGSTGLRALLQTRQSVFSVTIPATGTLNCPADNTSGDVTGNDITTSVERLGNADGTDCIAVPYSLTTGDHTVSFRKDLTNQTSAQFLLNVTWPEEAAIDPPGTTHTTTITYDGTTYHAVKWCLPASDPPPTGPDGGIFPVWTPPTGESYCLVTHDEQLQADGKVVVHEQFFGIGDPGLKR